MLDWRAQTLSDDMGPGARREEVLTADDEDGCEWMVAPHEDGTFNWMRMQGGELLELACDFPTAAAARAAAEDYARKVLG
jgi:hypothetical protein